MPELTDAQRLAMDALHSKVQSPTWVTGSRDVVVSHRFGPDTKCMYWRMDGFEKKVWRETRRPLSSGLEEVDVPIVDFNYPAAQRSDGKPVRGHQTVVVPVIAKLIVAGYYDLHTVADVPIAGSHNWRLVRLCEGWCCVNHEHHKFVNMPKFYHGVPADDLELVLGYEPEYFDIPKANS